MLSSSRFAREAVRACLITLATLVTVATGHAQGPKVEAVAGQPTLSFGAYDLAPLGYAVAEFFVSGTATSYTSARAPTEDGRWDAMPADSAPYVTRIVVARPTDRRKFSGTVVVEWLNVTGGTDAAVDWNAAHREIIRRGHAYVAVSAQRAGVEGGGGALGLGGTPVKKANPERYGRISHPGDAWSFDIFSQAGRILRGPDARTVLGPLVAGRVIAIGESQSAVFLTTYVNAVDPLAKVYDGFLVHSRFGSASPLQGSMGGGPDQPRAVKLRTDVRVPVLTVLTETDLLDSGIAGFHAARQPDHERLRIWEVAGTAHADNYTFTIGSIDSGSTPLEKLAAGYAPTVDVIGAKLAKPMNNAPQHHYVIHAALWHLDEWIRTRKAPPRAVPLTLAGRPPQFVVDAHGIAEGGVRTPWVDVPTARLSGVPNAGGQLAFLVGVTEPFDAATIDRLYPGGTREYLRKFEASLSAAIKAGFILAADRQEILDLAALGYRGAGD